MPGTYGVTWMYPLSTASAAVPTSGMIVPAASSWSWSSTCSAGSVIACHCVMPWLCIVAWPSAGGASASSAWSTDQATKSAMIASRSSSGSERSSSGPRRICSAK